MIAKEPLYNSLTIYTPFRNLVKVTLQECKFNFLPKEFGTLHNLQEIRLLRNHVVNTTQSAWEWLEHPSMRSNLKILKIKDYDLLELPLQITCLKNLRILNMTGNKIDFLPKEFGNLPLLNLNLSRNNLGRAEQFAWDWLMQIPIRNHLQGLDLIKNNITAIPLQITFLKNLLFLFLCDNEINFLPKEFSTLSQLLALDLSNNLLGTYPCTTWEWLEAPIKDNLLYLDISNNSLTEFPLQITCVKKLRTLDISENKIDFLPKELGTLPHLQHLDLSFNQLGKSGRNTWEWLEQASVRNKLSELYLSSNLLTELSPQIGKLNALTILVLDHNKLKCLPQSFANLRNLKHLNLYRNNLLYLPGSMAHLSMEIYVDKNSFDLENASDLTTNLKVPSLMEYSADVLLKSRLNYTNVPLPREMIRYLDEAKYCFFCETSFFHYYAKRFVYWWEYKNILNLEFIGSLEIWKAKFECYACSSECAKKLKN